MFPLPVFNLYIIRLVHLLVSYVFFRNRFDLNGNGHIKLLKKYSIFIYLFMLIINEYMIITYFKWLLNFNFHVISKNCMLYNIL